MGLAGESQNFTGDGTAVRYHAGFGHETVTTGKVASAGEPLVGVTENKLLGSRPRFTGVQPPLRPDKQCAAQQLPNLNAQTGPVEAQKALP